MSDVAEAAGSPVEKFGREWPLLGLAEYGQLEVKYKTARKESAKSTLEDFGDTLSPSERADKLLAKSSEPVTYWVIGKWLEGYAGAVEALRLSLKLAGVVKASEQDAELRRVRNIDNACLLAGLVAGYFTEKPKAEVKEGDVVVGNVSEGIPPDPS